MKSLIANTLFVLMQNYRVTIRQAINANELGLNAMHVRCLHIIAVTHFCTANDIVNQTRRDKAQIARLIKELVALKLVNKFANENDKRSFIISFTHEGKVLFTKLLNAEQQINEQMCKNLTPQQIQEFQHVASQMSDNIQGTVDNH